MKKFQIVMLLLERNAQPELPDGEGRYNYGSLINTKSAYLWAVKMSAAFHFVTMSL